MNPEAPQKAIAPDQENEEIINPAEVDEAEAQVDDPEYSPDDTEGIARAAAGATDVIEGAISGDRRMQSSYTHDGLRGVVEANVSDAHVRGEFADNELKKIEITLGDGSGNEVPVTVIHPESSNPRVMVGNEMVNPSEIPAVSRMIDHLKSASDATPELPTPEEASAENPEESSLEQKPGFDENERDKAA